VSRRGIVSLSIGQCVLTLTLLGVGGVPANAGQRPNPAGPASFPALVADKGRAIKLQSLRGHTVIVNFWASWCVPCRAELASLERLAAARSGKLIVIAASVDEDPRMGKAAFGNTRPHLRLAFASLAAVQNYGALGMPYSVILDAKGAEVQRITRSIDWTGSEATKIIARAQ
jgi:thiol-disulfide isomerase/thioredoxin